MKTIIVSLLASCVVSLAQTNPHNTDSRQLFNAATTNDVETVKVLLNKGVNINAKDTNGATALIKAASRGYADMTRLLLDKGAEINVKADYGWTALIGAAGGGYADMTRLLLDKGADINAKADEGITALMIAAVKGHADTVNLLLDKGADINVQDDLGWTALMFAVAGDKTNMVNILLDKGADINAKDNFGWNALMFAADKGQTKAVKILLNKGADINVIDTNGITAQLTGLIRDHHVEFVKLISGWWAGSVNAVFTTEKASSFAITNTDSSGYVTNANLLTPFTVTNSAGVVFTNAVLVKLMPNKFIYKTPGGAMGTLRLDALPEDLLQKIGYDPQVAQAADEAENQKKARQQELAQQQRAFAAQQAELRAQSKPQGSGEMKPNEVPVSTSRPDLEVLDLRAKVTEKGIIFWHWSYQLKVRNNTSQPIDAYHDVLFLDAEGFIIDKDLCKVKLSGGETKTFLGTAIITPPGAERVKATKFE